MYKGRTDDLDAEGDKSYGLPIKLFGRDIPVTSTNVSSCGKACPPLPVQGVKLEVTTCEAEVKVMISNELGSSSGSIDGCDEEKPNAATVGPERLKNGTLMTSESILMKGNDNKRHKLHDKILKKPDKVLPCPRCNSLETKFCYFNNYNVNQPRHFCKKCQRYWTAGGTVRNVPVGAGRRKNKHSISHQKHVMTDILTVRADAGDLARHFISSSITTSEIENSQVKKQGPMQARLQLLPPDACSFSALDSSSPSSTMLNFGQESPLCESMAAASLANTNMQHCGSNNEWTVQASSSIDLKPSTQSSMLSFSNQAYEPKRAAGSHPADTKVDVAASGSTSTVGMQISEDALNGPANPAVELKVDGFSLNVGGPWPYGLNMAWNTAAPPRGMDYPKFDGPGPVLTFPNFVPAWNGDPRGFGGFPWPLAMWGTHWPGRSWSVPWGPATTAAAAAATPTPTAAMSALQNHQTESSRLQHGNSGCLWVPKTLRIDDPVEAARSSIWTTLGLGDGPGASATGGGVATKVFNAKIETVDIETAGQMPHANPAAMSRSMTFHESS